MKDKIVMSVLVSMFTLGCATLKESVVTGSGVGAATGLVVHSTSKNRSNKEGALTSVLVGAIFGGITSYFIHGSLEKRDSKTRRKTLLNLNKFSVSTPIQNKNIQGFKVSTPDADKECFDWEIKGSKLVQKHCVWSIKGNSFWVPAVK